MLDADLAEPYGVRTKELDKAVGRNAARFPADFKVVFDAIRALMSPAVPAGSREMGFHTAIPGLRTSKKKRPAAVTK